MVLRHLILVAAALILGLAGSADAQPAKPKPDDMVNNRPYAHWSALKPAPRSRRGKWCRSRMAASSSP
jgi:hypothetical protein